MLVRALTIRTACCLLGLPVGAFAQSDGLFDGRLAPLVHAESESDSPRELDGLRHQTVEQEQRIRLLETYLFNDAPDREAAEADSKEPPPPSKEPRFEVGFDQGFFIRPTDKSNGPPFDLKIKARMQFRYTHLDSDVASLPDRSDFEIERGRLIFSGHIFDPQLGFFMQLDGDDDDNFTVELFDFYLTYAFDDAVQLSFGKAKVPASREWLDSAWRLQFADRAAATNFFRPSRAVGVWLHGEPVTNWNYIAWVGNGFRMDALSPAQIDDNLAFAGTVYWDMFGNYDPGGSDLSWHQETAVRIGASAMTTDMSPSMEQDSVRVVDTGTRLIDLYPGPMGAAAGFDETMMALDIAAKRCGWSIFGEYFFRWLENFKGANVPISHLYDHGYFIQSGYFVIPERLELLARHSRIVNDGGSPSSDEYTGGINWFFHGHDLRLTVDLTWLDGSPAHSPAANIRAGDEGLMLRTQFNMEF